MHPSSAKLLDILQYQLIPWWEQNGLERLGVNAPSLQEFEQQPALQGMRFSEKKRLSPKVYMSGQRTFNNVRLSVESFPQDAQEIGRHPILYCVLSGQADLHMADYVVHCPAGHFMLMRPGVPHPDGKRAHLEKNNPHDLCEIQQFSLLPGASSISTWVCVSRPGQHSTHYSHLIHQQDAVHLFRFFLNEILNTPTDYQITAHSSLRSFFRLMQRELKEGRLKPLPDKDFPNMPMPKDNPMQFAQEFMKSHLHHPLSVAQVAEAAYMSRSSFLRAFSRVTGQSFSQYLTALRVERAKELLSSNMSVQGVSENVGLKPAQLYRIFKSCLGISPSEFQQNINLTRYDRG